MTSDARRVLVEDAGAYRSPAQVRRPLQLRLETQPTIIQDISWQAQVRLCQRYRCLVSRGKHAKVMTVVKAPELPNAAAQPCRFAASAAPP